MARAPQAPPTAEALRSQQGLAMGTALPQATVSTRGIPIQLALGRAPMLLCMVPRGMQALRLCMTPQAMARMRLGEARRWVALLLCGRSDHVWSGLFSPNTCGVSCGLLYFSPVQIELEGSRCRLPMQG